MNSKLDLIITGQKEAFAQLMKELDLLANQIRENKINIDRCFEADNQMQKTIWGHRIALIFLWIWLFILLVSKM